MDVTDFSAKLSRRRDGGWSSTMMNHDGSTLGPPAARGCSPLELSEARGETAPGLQVNTKPRQREERHGICLFISPPHMLYLLHHHSESAQWGIRWTLHQLSEDAGTSTSSAAYIDVQHRKGGLLEGFGWQRSSFGALLKASGIALIFLALVRSPRHDAEPRLKRKKRRRSHDVPG